MSKSQNYENRKKVLVVEGYSDLLFYAEVLEYLGKHDQVFIKDLGGKKNLSLQLDLFLTPDLLVSRESIGIIVDADADALGTSQYVSSALKKATTVDVLDGVWIGANPKLGFFVAPGNGNAGEVETLVWQAWSKSPQNLPAKQCVDSYLNCMNQIGFKAHSPDKGRISSLLAVRADEDPRLGPGARENIFDFSLAEFAPLRNFLSQI